VHARTTKREGRRRGNTVFCFFACWFSLV